MAAKDRWNRDDRPPSIAVIETIAAIEGVDPIDLDVSLYDFVDLEAIDQVFLSENLGDVEMELGLGDHEATIRSDGSVEVQAV